MVKTGNNMIFHRYEILLKSLPTNRAFTFLMWQYDIINYFVFFYTDKNYGQNKFDNSKPTPYYQYLASSRNSEGRQIRNKDMLSVL